MKIINEQEDNFHKTNIEQQQNRPKFVSTNFVFVTDSFVLLAMPQKVLLQFSKVVNLSNNKF